VRRLVPLAAALLLAGCFTGARPSFGQGDPFAPGSPTTDPKAAPLLALLDREPTGPLHAEYDVLTKYGNTTSSAAITVEGAQRNVVIANVRYLVTTGGSFTCSADGTVPCVEGLDATRVSNVGITTHFYAADIARRIRREEQAKIGPTTAESRPIAGVTASCLAIPLGRGVSHYCVLPSGVVAFLDAGDVRITLTAYSPTADPTAFQK
jgi:hypothetical protein